MARAPINPDTLVWAREVGHVDIESLARHLGVKPERVEEFEDGEAKPTFRQLTLLAAKLDRPMGFFFAPPPEEVDVPATADFRGGIDDELPADLVREMRRAEDHRRAMLDLGDRPRRQIDLGPVTWRTITERAAQLREQFGLTEAFVPPESSNNQVFNFWRGLLEGGGILVFQVTRISLDIFRGLSVHHDELPIILINGADSPAARTFTLFHEVAHLVNRTSGLCELVETVDEEAIANNFAASFLMPERTVRALIGGYEYPADAVGELASHFKVSLLAAAVRLRRLDLITEGELVEVRAQSDERWKRAREEQKKGSGFVPPWRLRYRDLGPSYIGIVAQALEDRRVDMVDATYLLNARMPMVEQMLKEFYRAGGPE